MKYTYAMANRLKIGCKDDVLTLNKSAHSQHTLLPRYPTLRGVCF